MIVAIFFDLNGIFLEPPYLSEVFYKRFHITEDVFMPVFRKVKRSARLSKEASIYELWKPYFHEWGIELSERELFNLWFRREIVNTKMLEIAYELYDNNVRLFVTSNNFRERTGFYRMHYPFLNPRTKNPFEKIYYSWQIGYVKPDEEYYQYVLDDTGLSKEEVLYIDDSQKNVDAATTFGLTSCLYENPEQIKKAIGAHGLLG